MLCAVSHIDRMACAAAGTYFFANACPASSLPQQAPTPLSLSARSVAICWLLPAVSSAPDEVEYRSFGWTVNPPMASVAFLVLDGPADARPPLVEGLVRQRFLGSPRRRRHVAVQQVGDIRPLGQKRRHHPL